MQLDLIGSLDWGSVGVSSVTSLREHPHLASKSRRVFPVPTSDFQISAASLQLLPLAIALLLDSLDDSTSATLKSPCLSNSSR